MWGGKEAHWGTSGCARHTKNCAVSWGRAGRGCGGSMCWWRGIWWINCADVRRRGGILRHSWLCSPHSELCCELTICDSDQTKTVNYIHTKKYTWSWGGVEEVVNRACAGKEGLVTQRGTQIGITLWACYFICESLWPIKYIVFLTIAVFQWPSDCSVLPFIFSEGFDHLSLSPLDARDSKITFCRAS